MTTELCVWQIYIEIIIVLDLILILVPEYTREDRKKMIWEWEFGWSGKALDVE